MTKAIQGPENNQDIEKYEISINYVSTGKRWNRREIVYYIFILIFNSLKTSIVIFNLYNQILV